MLIDCTYFTNLFQVKDDKNFTNIYFYCFTSYTGSVIVVQASLYTLSPYQPPTFPDPARE
jgi:hypothetical protein